MASKENERRRESENLKDAIDRSVPKTVSDTDRDDAVQPIVFWGACLEHWIHPEVIARRVNSLALVQFLHDVWRTGAQALVSHYDECFVRRPEHKPDVQFDTRVRAHRLPVVAADHFAR